MSKRQAQAAQNAASVATLQAQLAELESELATAIAVQDNANQASVWAYNAMGASDAFIARSEHDKFIKRLEQLSFDADTLKADADVLVRRLRDSKRALTQQLGSRVNDKQMSAERERAEQSTQAQVKAQASQAKAVTKRKTKTQLIAEAKKQTASKKKAA